MFISQTLRRAVQLNPNGVATIYANRKQGWREFENRVARLAAGVRSLKVADGDRVAILSLNSDRYLEYFYAISWAGMALYHINYRLSLPQFAYAMYDSGSS